MSPELPEALRVALRVIDVLDELRVRYHVGGSYASSIHGIPRQTQDIDLVVELPPEAAGPLASMLGDEFYVDTESVRRAARDKTSANVIHLDSGIKVDLFVRGDSPFDREEFKRHRRELIRREPERHVYVKTAEDILLRKLAWYRMGGETSDRQWSDVLGIARIHGEMLDREYVERWARELGVADLLEKVLAGS
jgi:hypothetical protein